MKKLILLFACAMLAGPVIADVDREDIRRYFEDNLNNRDVLKEYQARIELEVRAFVICARAATFQEAMEIRGAGVKLQKRRKALREEIMKYETSHRDAYQMLKLNTVDSVEAAYRAHRECAEHAANLKFIETEGQ